MAQAQKTKKRKWLSLLAPPLFGEVVVGETYLDSVEQLKGKYVSANLATITNDMKKQNFSVTLRVNKVVEGKGLTEVIGIHMLQGNLKRLIRRGRTKIDDSFTAKTSDGALIRIKPLVITNTICTRSAGTQVRALVREKLIKLVTESTFVTLLDETLSMKIQKSLKADLGKITPIRSVDIRVIERECDRGRVPDQELALTPQSKIEVATPQKVDDEKEEPIVDDEEE